MVSSRKRETSTLVSRNVVINARRTSLRLEPEMWESLDEIAMRERTSINEIVAFVDRQREIATLTSDVRVFILQYFRSAATERGHWSVGHGALFQRGVSDRKNDAETDALHEGAPAIDPTPMNGTNEAVYPDGPDTPRID